MESSEDLFSPIKYQNEDEIIKCSQTSSSLPSPVPVHKLHGWTSLENSEKQLTDSQVSSLLPSPMVITIGQLLSDKNKDTFKCDIKSVYEKLRELAPEEKVSCLNILLPQMGKSDLGKLGGNIINHVAHVLGEYCHDKIKTEADYFRLKRSRDEDDDYMTAANVLTKKLKVEPVHVFFEKSTGKSGRFEGKHQSKVAPLQATFYECLLKGSNLNTIPIYQMSKMNKMKSKVSSRALYQDQPGGSYTFHQNNLSAPPLEMSFNGPLITDNAQRGASKYQHHKITKLDRSIPVLVSTHNIRAESDHGVQDNEIFKNEKVTPYNSEFHPIFRPVDPEFVKIVESRVNCDRKHGQVAANTIMEKWMTEVIDDKKVGKGKSSFEKVSDRLNFGSSARTVICPNCHTDYEYKVQSSNLCSVCHNNPTYYTESELGPYRKYNFPERTSPNLVEAREQEPVRLNPSGKQNLLKLEKQLRNYWPPDVKSFPFYGDGLPSISYERIKSDSVDCVTHNINIPLKDTKLLTEHCAEECDLDWPLKHLFVISGESHEEIAMNVQALSKSVPFGVLEMLSGLGRCTKKSQMQAIRSKRLHTLYELNHIFTKGSFTALVIPFLDNCVKSGDEETIENLFKYVEQSQNLHYQARFRALMSFNIPCIVKRLGIRLDNEQISNGGSALFFYVAFATNTS